MTSETPKRVSWLDRVCTLNIKLWRYRRDIDPSQELHIGPMAEQWHEVMGIGDGRTINLIDANGVLLKAIQELTERVKSLENKGPQDAQAG